jgi:hypothetical protein
VVVVGVWVGVGWVVVVVVSGVWGVGTNNVYTCK